MKKAFKPKAVVSLLANLNRKINGNHYRCYYLYIYPNSNALFNLTKGIQSLLQELYIIIGGQKECKQMDLYRSVFVDCSGRNTGITGERNACFGLNAENKHTISYQNNKKTAYDIE